MFKISATSIDDTAWNHSYAVTYCILRYFPGRMISNKRYIKFLRGTLLMTNYPKRYLRLRVLIRNIMYVEKHVGRHWCLSKSVTIYAYRISCMYSLCIHLYVTMNHPYRCLRLHVIITNPQYVELQRVWR